MATHGRAMTVHAEAVKIATALYIVSIEATGTSVENAKGAAKSLRQAGAHVYITIYKYVHKKAQTQQCARGPSKQPCSTHRVSQSFD